MFHGYKEAVSGSLFCMSECAHFQNLYILLLCPIIMQHFHSLLFPSSCTVKQADRKNNSGKKKRCRKTCQVFVSNEGRAETYIPHRRRLRLHFFIQDRLELDGRSLPRYPANGPLYRITDMLRMSSMGPPWFADTAVGVRSKGGEWSKAAARNRVGPRSKADSVEALRETVSLRPRFGSWLVGCFQRLKFTPWDSD